MKTEQPDRFWRVYGVVFAAGLVSCLLLGALLIEMRPKINLEAVASDAPPTGAAAWSAFAPESPAYSPW